MRSIRDTNLAARLKKLFHRIVDRIFPHLCSTCGEKSKSGLAICTACQWHLPWVEEACRQCGLPTQTSDDWRDCEKCREKRPEFDRVCALFHYRSPVKQMITQLKFSKRLSVAKDLGVLFASRLPDHGYTQDNLPEVVIPIPLHEKRLRQRGYNQAYELGRGLLQYSDNLDNQRLLITINDRLCQRIKSTAAQSGLGKSDRQKNVAGAFSIAPEIANYRHVAILDDVVTTGATVNALSRALKLSGIEQVDVWCICRA